MRRVRYRPKANEDLSQYLETIAVRISPQSSVKWRIGIEAVFRALQTDAEQWPGADEALEVGVDLRCRLYGRRRQVYRILFTIEPSTVTIHRVRHASQDYLTPNDL